jgi:hypothetical protein
MLANIVVFGKILSQYEKRYLVYGSGSSNAPIQHEPIPGAVAISFMFVPAIAAPFDNVDIVKGMQSQSIL